uniref:Uncharacterized protein n=1 Tax=Arundo donax TaxID=35708 RepID=A0A0A9H4P6_ARUDO
MYKLLILNFFKHIEPKLEECSK